MRETVRAWNRHGYGLLSYLRLCRRVIPAHRKELVPYSKTRRSVTSIPNSASEKGWNVIKG